MTKLSPVGTFGVLNDPDRQAAVSGRPAIGVDLMLADATGAPLSEQRGPEGRLLVRGAAVIGRSDPKWGDRPLLVVELHAGEDLADEMLLECVRGRVASWWVPDAVLRVAAMPLASTGKIDKLGLRAAYSRA